MNESSRKAGGAGKLPGWVQAIHERTAMDDGEGVKKEKIEVQLNERSVILRPS